MTVLSEQTGDCNSKIIFIGHELPFPHDFLIYRDGYERDQTHSQSQKVFHYQLALVVLVFWLSRETLKNLRLSHKLS